MEILLTPQQLKLKDLAEIAVGELFYSPEGAGRHGGLCLKLAHAQNRQGYVSYLELEGGQIPFHYRSESEHMRHDVLPLGITDWRLRLSKNVSNAYDPYDVGNILVTSDGPLLVVGTPGLASEVHYRFVSLTDCSHTPNYPEDTLIVFPSWELAVQDASGRISALFKRAPAASAPS